MVDESRLMLRRSLVDGYAKLRQRLTRRLGSPALATEALSEAWLQMGQGRELGPIADTDAYVYRAALNAASALGQRERRQAGHGELGEVAELADDAPLADRVVASRQEVAQLAAALAELPTRQQEAFLLCYRGDMPPEELAARYQVTVRTIQSDIRSAILHCAERLGRKNVFAGRRVSLSKE